MVARHRVALRLVLPVSICPQPVSEIPILRAWVASRLRVDGNMHPCRRPPASPEIKSSHYISKMNFSWKAHVAGRVSEVRTSWRMRTRLDLSQPSHVRAVRTAAEQPRKHATWTTLVALVVGTNTTAARSQHAAMRNYARLRNRAYFALENVSGGHVRLPWRLKWTLAQFARPADYQKHSAALQSAPAFYFTALEKLVSGLSPETKYLPLTDGHIIPVRDFMTLYIYKEIFVDRCYDLTLDQPAPVIIDIGANSGLFALRLKQLYPSAKILCYEPFPSNFAQLQNTISVNKLGSVTPLQKAVGARAGRAKLFIHKRNMGGHSFYSTAALNTDYVDVEVIDLPSVLGGVEQEVDLLKLDCEGAEFDILMGLTASDARRIRRVIVETTSDLYDVDQLNAQMVSLGYRQEPRNDLRLYVRPLDA